MATFRLRYAIFILLLLTKVTGVVAQNFFDDEISKDTLPKPFYLRNHHLTVCYTVGLTDYMYGASMLIHYNNERVSPYFEFRYNNQNSRQVYGTKTSIVPEVIYSSKDTVMKDSLVVSIERKSYSYRSYVFSVGIASAPTSYLIVYANVGARYARDNFGSPYQNGVYFRPPSNNVELVYGGGLFYLFPNGLTGQLGADFSEFILTLGLGYTF